MPQQSKDERIITARVLLKPFELRHKETVEHCNRVSDLAQGFGSHLNLRQYEVDTLGLAGVLHDVGKLTVPRDVLCKPGALTDDERAVMAAHPGRGARFASSLTTLKRTAPIIAHHHERFDGAGYPDGLKTFAIPYAARVMAICDSFDAMTSHRPWRDAMTFEAALTELDKQGGKQFDPWLVESFIEFAGEHVVEE